MTITHAIGLGVLGVVVGALGTVMGAGGGFILLPALVLLYPHEPAATLTAVSLLVVCVNAASGSLAYARMRRIDTRSALIFIAAGLPGAIAGAWSTRWLRRQTFDPLVGAILVAVALSIFFVPHRDAAVPHGAATRRLVERSGVVHEYRPRIGLGIVVSVLVGFVSSLLGIGGGIIHVPAMVALLGFTPHVATATSHLVVAVLALAGVLVHLREGTLAPGLARSLPLVVGASIGAQLGARLSTRIRGRWILMGLGVALGSVGVRLLLVR